MKKLISAILLSVIFLAGCTPSAEELRKQRAEASKVEAEAAQAWLDVKINEAAMQAVIAERIQQARTREIAFTITLLSLAFAFGIVAITGSIGTGRYVFNRLSSVYADSRGIFPLQIKQGIGPAREPYVIVHDANRQLGATTIYQIGQGGPRQTEHRPEDARPFLEVTTNAQRAATVAAIAPHVGNRVSPDVLPGARSVGAPVASLPDVTRSNLEPSHVRRLLADVLDDDEEGG